MECKGELKSILGVDGKKINILLTLEVNPEAINPLTNKTLTVQLKEYHPKRSLDSNSYMWVLTMKMAEILKTSKDELYESLLFRYGQPYLDENGNRVFITLKNNIDVKLIPGHWMWVKEHNGFSSYMMIKGTSDYDSKEMAHFIDMIVEEAKALGIEVLPPDELERMKNEWTQYCNKTKSATSATQQ